MSDCAGSIYAVRLRVARLDESGVPDPGAGNLYVTDTLIRLAVEFTYSEAETIEQKNGAGQVCISDEGDDALTGANVTMELCTPDPELVEMCSGGVVLEDDDDNPIGWAAPQIGEAAGGFGVSIEAWSKAQVGGAPAASNPYWRWALGRSKFRIPNRELANAAGVTTLVGKAYENPNWFDGPANDWTWLSDRLFAYVRDDSVPAAVCGAQALAAS